MSELVYDEILPLPGEFFSTSKDYVDPATFVGWLRDHASTIRPVPTSLRTGQSIFVHNALSSCSHVFLRQDNTRSSLQPFCTRPFRVLFRNDKIFTIFQNNRNAIVNIDRLKPVFIDVMPDTVPPESLLLPVPMIASPQPPSPPTHPPQSLQPSTSKPG